MFKKMLLEETSALENLTTAETRLTGVAVAYWSAPSIVAPTVSVTSISRLKLAFTVGSL